jgi:hypothetical protein
MPGGGNHRGSIFRAHVGSALLGSGAWPASIHNTWLVGSSAELAVRRLEYPLECAVTSHIGAMPFLWVEVSDPAEPDSDRGAIEAGAIALLSNLGREPIDAPSEKWLGRCAARTRVRDSGLWNVRHVEDPARDSFLGVLESWIRR